MDNPTKRAILLNAAKLLARGECRGTMARREDGLSASLYGPDAHTFCIEGSIQRACYDAGAEPYSDELVDIVEECIPPINYRLSCWWDGPSKPSVEDGVSLITRAAGMLEA